MKIQASILLAGTSLALSGCGIRGDLERPPPIWGPDERSEDERAYETEGSSEPASAEDAADEAEGGS